MATSNLMIGIGAEYRGKAAFREAETATQKLTKNVRNLAGAIGIAFSTRAVVNFAKASVKASLEAGAQQDRLAQLLKVTSNASAAQVAVLTEQADALERIGVVSKDSITQVQSQLATFDLSISTIEKLTPAILNYVTAEKGATASAAEYKSMTNGLAQALNGNFTSLTKTGFVLDEVTKSTIANGSEAKRAAAIVKVLDSTYKGFNERLAQTPAGQMQLLANASEDVRTTIGNGIVGALAMLTDGNIIKLTDAMRELADESSHTILGIGIVADAINNEIQKTSRRIEEDLSKNIPFLNLKEGDINLNYVLFTTWKLLNTLGDEAVKNKAKLRDMMNYPDPQSGRKLDIQLKAKAKADKAAGAAMRKFERERLAAEKKRTLELKKQEALKKAMKVLDTASNLFDIDLIQNTAALMGKIDADQALRLRLQQAILLENEDAAASLAQQLLASQIAAMKLANQNPLEGWGKYFADALAALKQLRDELAALGTPKVAVPSVIAPPPMGSPGGTAGASPFTTNNNGVSIYTPWDTGTSRQSSYSQTPSNFTYNQGNPLAVEVFVNPDAMAYGITAAVINNTANGNSNTSNTIKSYAGGA
jgi:hypothetical protein